VFVRDLKEGTTHRVSVASGGAQANGSNASTRPGISDGGRFVVFCSEALGFVPDDTNDAVDVFVHDRQTGTTRRATVGLGGAQANGTSFGDAISANGRYVAFWSFATNLVRGDTNGERDVFVRDLVAGTTRKASVGREGAQANGLSAGPTLSADGRLIGFFSDASNLVPRDTNGDGDGFVRNLAAATTKRVTLTSGGAQANGGGGPILSADGRVAAFPSRAVGLVPGDTNGLPDVFVRKLEGGTTERVSVGPGGAQANRDSYAPALSSDGSVVAFTSNATNLVPGDTNGLPDVFVRVR
jgi:Tol biopolymer transport system component